MVNYGEAFRMPFTDLKKLLIGIVLQLIPIVNFISFGYQLECAKSAMEKKFELPEWKKWLNLFVKGIIGFVISIIYMIPAIIILLLVAASLFSVLTSGLVGGMGRMSAVSGMFSTLGITAIIVFILLLISIYIIPSALMAYVKNGNFTSAFKFGEVFKKALNLNYFLIWIVAMLYYLILSGVLSIIPYIGTSIGAFIAGVTSMSLFGELYSEK